MSEDVRCGLCGKVLNGNDETALEVISFNKKDAGNVFPAVNVIEYRVKFVHRCKYNEGTGEYEP